VFIGTLAVLHVIRPGRGKAVVQALFGEIRPMVWVSDMPGSQRGHAVEWQVCLAHLLCDATYAIECGDTAFSAAFKRLLLRAIAIGRRRDALKDITLTQYRADLDRRLSRIMAAVPIVIVATATIEVPRCRMAAVMFIAIGSCVIVVTILLAFAIPYRASGRSRSIADGLEAVAIWSAFTTVGGVLTHLAMRTHRPLTDASFAQADARLGFSWLAWQAAVMSHQFLATVLHLCSATLAPQLLATVLLGFLGHGERVREFLWAAILSIDVTTIIAGLLPAASAPALFGVDPGVARYQDTLILRGDAPATFTLHHLTGLVSFPSYHAVLAVMLVRAFRGYGWITGAAVAMNIAVIISALVPGGHYLVDLIAGVAVAIVAIIVTRWGMPGSLRARSVSGPGSQSA
jgi:hypothetical protein